jgi:hypothetical protein
VYRQMMATLPELQAASAALVDGAAAQAASDLQKGMREEAQKNTAAAAQRMQAGDFGGALASYRSALDATPAVAPDSSRLLGDLLVLGYRLSGYVRTGQKTAETDAVSRQAGIDVAAERAQFLKDLGTIVTAQEEKARADALQQASVAAKAAEMSLRSQIADQDARIALAEKKLAAADAGHEAELLSLAEKAKSTRQDLAQRIGELVTFESQLNDLRSAYASYGEREKTAAARNPQDPAMASRQELNTFLRAAPTQALLPALGDRIDALYAATQSAASSATLTEAADIITNVLKQPTIDASRQQLRFEIQGAKDNARLAAILQAVDGVLAKAQGTAAGQ